MFSRKYDKTPFFDNTQISYLATALIAVVMIILLGIELWGALTTLRYQPEQPLTTQPVRTDNSVNYKVTSITRSHLFGQLAGQSADSQNIPVTTLQFKLRGAFTSTNSQLASAIIEGPDGQTRSYKVNHRVYGQAELKEVFNDRIVLSRNGELETLYFPKPESIPDNTATTNRSNPTAMESYDIPDDIQTLVKDTMSAREIQQAAKELTSASMSAEQRQQLIRKRLQDLRNRANRKK